MKITSIKSASIIVEHEEYRLLCDPWLEDGIYLGSWCHYPPLKEEVLQGFLEGGINGIYISHIHPDHCSTKSLERFPKDIPIYIHKYGFFDLRDLLIQLGFTNIIQLRHGQAAKLSTDLYIEIYAADNCNPELCGKQFGCQYLGNLEGSMQIDTMSVIYTACKNHVIVNTNDCQYGLAKGAIERIKKEHNHVDVLLTGYVSASSYPQCFENLSVSEKLFEKERLQSRFLSKAAYFARDLRPKVIIPFAGEYVLAGKLWELNNFLSPPPKEHVKYLLDEKLMGMGLRFYTYSLVTGGFIDLDEPEGTLLDNPDRSAYTQIKRLRYIKNHLKDRRLDYEHLPEVKQDLSDLFLFAMQQMHMVAVKQKINVEGKKVAIEPEGEDCYLVDFENPFHIEKCWRSTAIENKIMVIKLDKRLLQMLLLNNYTWNHAEIGSHFSFYRHSNVYDRTLFYLLNHLHT